jgi:ribonuclease P protein component
MNQRLYKTERLKSQKIIETLFAKGEKLSSYPVKLIYQKNENTSAIAHQVAFSVPKRNIKKAVDRNKIKRRMREAYRKNKHLLNLPDNIKLAYMFIYLEKTVFTFQEIEQKIKILLLRLNEKNFNSEN